MLKISSILLITLAHLSQTQSLVTPEIIKTNNSLISNYYYIIDDSSRLAKKVGDLCLDIIRQRHEYVPKNPDSESGCTEISDMIATSKNNNNNDNENDQYYQFLNNNGNCLTFEKYPGTTQINLFFSDCQKPAELNEFQQFTAEFALKYPLQSGGYSKVFLKMSKTFERKVVTAVSLNGPNYRVRKLKYLENDDNSEITGLPSNPPDKDQNEILNFPEKNTTDSENLKSGETQTNKNTNNTNKEKNTDSSAESSELETSFGSITTLIILVFLVIIIGANCYVMKQMNTFSLQGIKELCPCCTQCIKDDQRFHNGTKISQNQNYESRNWFGVIEKVIFLWISINFLKFM